MRISEMLKDIHDSIGQTYLAGTMVYIDNKYDNAWSNEMNKLDRAILDYERTNDEVALQDSFFTYRCKALDWISEYKKIAPKRLGVQSILEDLEE